MKSDVLSDTQSMGDQRLWNTGFFPRKLSARALQPPAEYPLSQKAPWEKKNLKMDFQVVNVPLITEVRVGTSSSMNLCVTQQG